jgi:hypothetical protein
MTIRLTRDAFLAADDLPAEEVDLSDLPGYSGSLLVRGMTGRERDEFEASLAQQRGGQVIQNMVNVRAKIVIRCVVDEDGRRVFDDADIDVLGGKSGAALDRLFTVATRLSGLGERDVEDLTGNFGGPNGASSSSASPATSGKPSRASSPR